MALDVSKRIMVRSGFHCAMPLHKEVLGERQGSVRASTYLYNTEEEKETFISAVEEVARTFI
ncbi:aminotransferase class V-fold PLP-dependent enzyme [Candidatus Bathyarchaeota archaeon]|nr:aminotransferase class V-fold PLP-dependent enzyme [Candidatus Bathyarchaeota archaeon]